MKRKYTLFGLNRYEEIVEKVVNELKDKCDEFNIRLIITEALRNSYIHGNEGDDTKPIYFSYKVKETKVRFEFTDCGQGLKDYKAEDDFTDFTDLCLNGGRGLFLIKKFSNNVVVKNNSLIVYKNFCQKSIKGGKIYD